MEKFISRDEVDAYASFLDQKMQIDAAAVKAFGEPLHLSKEEWDKRAAEGWKTTDYKPDEDA